MLEPFLVSPARRQVPKAARIVRPGALQARVDRGRWQQELHISYKTLNWSLLF
jgi:hypothetical protein